MAKGMTGKQIVDAPYEYYAARYGESDACEIAARTGLEFDAAGGRFRIRFFGTWYYVDHPVFKVYAIEAGLLRSARDGEGGCAGFDAGPLGPYEEILLMRFLLEGIFAPASGVELSYDEMPSGMVYSSQFNGRVIGRLARVFGKDPS
ncbi:MAG: DUF3786 domain-containing protein, partial [Acidobacteriota bacterium]|nr:DUF3786 domain-containing protein [Acidobacteriota bacterium]